MSAGLVQGMVTGMRGLCNGLGPAMFGLIFYLFHVDLNYDPARFDNNTTGQHTDVIPQVQFNLSFNAPLYSLHI